MPGIPLDRPKKLFLWEGYSVQGPKDLTKWAEISYASYGANLEQSSGVRTRGGNNKGENSTFWLTWRGSWTSFSKLTLAPASSVSGLSSHQIWSCAHKTRVRYKSSKLRFWTLSETPSQRCPEGSFSPGRNILRMHRGRKDAHKQGKRINSLALIDIAINAFTRMSTLVPLVSASHQWEITCLPGNIL